eukprot:Phypoly_transcript_05448.p1 GENE.Phypoly_transcript_05448~~Phypoly_transcript_05448.p1  ORF type:complete len:578 (-),score=71.98 Phypoly_transcript_05448:158-1891(-)
MDSRESYAEEWARADRDGSGKLNFSEISKLLNKLNLGLKDSDLKQRIKEIDSDANKELDFKEFSNFLDTLNVRLEFKTLFNQYAKGKQFLSPQDLWAFLREQQFETTLTLEAVQAIIGTYEQNNSQLTFVGFSKYMTSPENSVYNFQHTARIYQPMSYPLSNYYIAASHNTYAERHQLVGTASVDAYIHALKKGCKCLELDVWDGEHGYPIITHGHTLLTKLKFSDVIEAIRDYAFCVSPYPVILSFENHCSEGMQIQMASILTDILGKAGMLANHLFGKVFPLPSPDQLKNKVLIKNKVLSAPSETVVVVEKKKNNKEIAVALELSNLVHLSACKFPTILPHDHKNKVFEVYSISEHKVESNAKKEFDNLVALTNNQVIKVYPKGTRFGSSNYSPTQGWAVGCQLVCLNYQTNDEPMWLNTGKFMDNGGCGYVLKPNTLLAREQNVARKTLTVNLISGWRLPKETGTTHGAIINPYVRIKVFGHPDDFQKFKSRVIRLDGFNPYWNETVSFGLSRPELAQIIFEVYESDSTGKDDFLGYSSIPVASIKPGYRNAALYDSKSNPLLEASLFVRMVFA